MVESLAHNVYRVPLRPAGTSPCGGGQRPSGTAGRAKPRPERSHLVELLLEADAARHPGDRRQQFLELGDHGDLVEIAAAAKPPSTTGLSRAARGCQ